MGTININGNDKEQTNLSQDQKPEQAQDKEAPNPEFKVDISLFEIAEATLIKNIHNLS